MEVITGLFGRLEFYTSGVVALTRSRDFPRLARAAVDRANVEKQTLGPATNQNDKASRSRNQKDITVTQFLDASTCPDIQMDFPGMNTASPLQASNASSDGASSSDRQIFPLSDISATSLEHSSAYAQNWDLTDISTDEGTLWYNLEAGSDTDLGIWVDSSVANQA